MKTFNVAVNICQCREYTVEAPDSVIAKQMAIDEARSEYPDLDFDFEIEDWETEDDWKD